MSEKFSPTLRLGDLNDFIAPSQACVISLKDSKPIVKKSDRPQVRNFHAFSSFLSFLIVSSSSRFLSLFHSQPDNELLVSFDMNPIYIFTS